MPTQRPNRLSTFLGKITRNLSLNKYEYYAAEKRGAGQVPLVLEELQVAVMDHLSQEIGLSQTVGGVQVTVDSATVGDDTFFVLLRLEGLNFSNSASYGFDEISMTVQPDPLEAVHRWFFRDFAIMIPLGFHQLKNRVGRRYL